MWNRFLLSPRAFRLQLVGALLTLGLSSLFAMSCSSTSSPPTYAAGGVGNSTGGASPTGGVGNPGAGSAAVQCTGCSSTQVCNNGTCGCAPGRNACGQNCVDFTSDGANCGACGMACPTTAPFCSGSQCIATCPGGTTTCGTSCVNTQTDPMHCGTCPVSCPSGVCSAGVCTAVVGAGGATGAGGNGAGGGTANAGAGGASARPPGCPAGPALLSDFEEGKAVLVPQSGRTGWWYVYNDSPPGTTTGMQTPPNLPGPIAVAMLPANDTPAPSACNKYALHSSASAHPMYVGFGATFAPGATAAMKTAVNLSAYTGISFRIKSGAGTAPPIWFEILNKETQPVDLSGTAANPQVDAYNTRGRLLSTITTSWQTISVPFSTLAPRYVPGGCGAGVKCEAPPFNPASALSFQFSLYDQFNTSGAYDLWVDDVTLTTDDSGLPTIPAGTAKFPFPQDRALGNGCLKPTGATGKAIVEAYQRWKTTFVTADGANLRVKFDDPTATVSEGIAYGMLIAVFMNDKPLFDGLLGYWKMHASGDSMLMTWKINGGGGSGSAIDADEDAAFALIQANKQWTGGTYLADANTLLTQMRGKELDPGTNAVRPGNQFPAGASALTNPSYFAPAYYRVFATVDTAGAANWNGAAASVYAYLGSISGSDANGLVPAWCTNSCANRGGGGYANADKYQYDAHRMPWRMALDVCWNNNAAAKTYVGKTTNFFNSKSGPNAGLGSLADEYNADGSACTTCTPSAKQNSMSLIGTATAGAMATGNAANQDFINRGWRFLLDGAYTADPTFRTGPLAAYTYYNATVGLLMALTLSGNFNNL